MDGWNFPKFRVMIETEAPHAVHVGKDGASPTTINLDTHLADGTGNAWHNSQWRWSFDIQSYFAGHDGNGDVSASGFADLAFVTELE
jgi:hypothetical protein